jgi:multisubunit Na+/H+ antiporter MnhC subunit
MKKMRGFVDPISLGFILSAVVFGVGVTTGNKTVENNRVAKAKVESSQQITVKHVTTPKVQQDNHAVYDY